MRGIVSLVACLAVAGGLGLFVWSQETRDRTSGTIELPSMELVQPMERGESDPEDFVPPEPERLSITPEDSESARDGSMPSGESKAEAAPTPEVADASGMTREEKLQALVNMHDMYLLMSASKPPAEATFAELNFATRAVATIMREQGRADYGDPAQLAERGGFSLRPSTPDEHVFAADKARFSFLKGEFSAYDLAASRCVPPTKDVTTSALTPEEVQEYEQLFERALMALHVDSNKEK